VTPTKSKPARAPSEAEGGGTPSTRDAIREAAVKIFFENGYSAATVREIASELGIKAGSIYNHYPSKQQILVDLMTGTLAELTERVDEAVASATTPTEALRAAIIQHVSFHRNRYREAFVADTELRSLEPDAFREFAKQRTAYERRIQRILEEGHKSGEFEVSDVRVVSYAIITACSAVPTWFKPAGRLTIDQVGEIYSDLILNGLLRRSGGTRRRKR
jgi:AcrR family transcriptional regulator